ncbi:MAG: hypothetical protein ACI957_004206 [Verrucomicrobiales bacterium]|jgi:hypothetical protein
MNRGVFALFVRTMREENRRVMTYATRFLLVLLVLLVIGVNHSSFRYGGGAPGLRIFQFVTMLNLAFICIMGLSYFASAITEEKEDGTLGLLRMTDLNPLSILLGKSTSRLIGFLLILLTQLPFITMAVALGGVTLLQIVNCYAVLGAFAFLLANLTLIFSVMCRRTATAVSSTLLLLIVVFLGVFFLSHFFKSWLGSSLGFDTLSSWVWSTNPLKSLIEINSLGSSERIVMQPLSNIIIGIVFFVISWLIFDFFNQGEGRGAAPKASRRPAVASTKAFAGDKPRPADFAVTWREFYFRCGGVKRLWISFALIMGLSGLIMFVGGVMNRQSMDIEDVGGVLFTIGLMSAGVLWALEMGVVFKHERLNQTWAALTLSPKSIQRVAYEKVLASVVTILPSLLVAGFGLVLTSDQWHWSDVDGDFMLGLFLAVVFLVFSSHLIVCI